VTDASKVKTAPELPLPDRMRAWVLDDPGQLSLVEKPVPMPGRAEVLVRIDAVAICATDLEIIAHGPPAMIRGGDPFNKNFTPGHEYMGTVAALGPGVDEYRIGQRVTVEIHAGCGQCKRCREGMYTACLNYGLNYGEVDKGHRANGFTTDGGFAEYAVNNINTLVAIPDSMSDAEATLVVTAGTAMYGLTELGGLVAGEGVAVLGPGPIGLLGVAVAKALGARHESIEINEAMVWRHLPEIVACMDDPAADYAIIPTWFLAQRARQDVKVVLSGEGGDEIFAGYPRYRSAMKPWWLGGRAMYARGSFDRLNVLRTRPAGWRDGIAAAELRAAEGGRSRLAAAQATDMTDWLPHDLLLKLDRCLMAHAVEGRTPFLDKGVAAAAFRLPDAMKLRDGMGKWILRKWLEKHLPMARPFAPKQGFTVPVGAWIKGQGGRLGPLVAAQPGVMEIADPERVVALFRGIRRWRDGFAAWKLLFYALWHRRHILGLPPVGDVFETLGAK